MSIGILYRLPKKETIRDRSRVSDLVWHCQTVKTFHPRARSRRLSRASFLRLRSSFGNQKSSRDLGGRPIRHPCACQKQPLMKMAFRRDGKTMSGVPGKSRRWRRNRYPSEWIRRRTSNSGAVSFPPMRAISALRLALDRLSVMVPLSILGRGAILRNA